MPCVSTLENGNKSLFLRIMTFSCSSQRINQLLFSTNEPLKDQQKLRPGRNAVIVVGWCALARLNSFHLIENGLPKRNQSYIIAAGRTI